MKKVLVRSLITALAVNTIGATINFVSYFFNKTFLLSQTINGGEWQGRRGFGLILQRTQPDYPVLVSEAYKIKTWVSLDFLSLFLTLAVGFIFGFIIFSTIYLIGKIKNAKNHSLLAHSKTVPHKL